MRLSGKCEKCTCSMRAVMERCDGNGVGVRGWKGGMVMMEV